MHTHRLLHCIFITVSLGVFPTITLAQPNLTAAVEAAWQRSPQARTLEAGLDEVQAEQDAAQSWIAGSPSIGLENRSDRWTDQTGLNETQVSLSAPIWLPGQKSARQSLAQRGADNLDAQLTYARLTIAGEVRERLWAVAAARESLIEAQDHLYHLEGLAEEVMRRVKAGDLARADGLLSQQEVLAAKGAVAMAQTRERDALLRYTVLTGQKDIPVPEPEPLAETRREPHPRLWATQTALQRAQASLDAVHAIRRDPPVVGVAMRREREPGITNPSRSVAVSVQIPLGTQARNRPLETAALTQIATTRAEAAQAESTLQGEIELARQQLTTSRQSLEAAETRAALGREHTQLIKKAFRLGEKGLAELLRSEALSHEAEMAERQQRVAVGLAHARFNQALGVIP